METLANNGHSNADEADNVENGLLENNHSALVSDNVVGPSGMDLEDVNVKVNTKKRAFDEESKALHSPSKKLAVTSSSDALIAGVDSTVISSPLTEAMNIDSTREEAGER